MGSLTSRLLSATVCASAETAAALRSNPSRSLSANVRGIFGYAHVPCSRLRHDRDDGMHRYSPQKGGDGPPGAITPSITPSVLCQAVLEWSEIDGRDPFRQHVRDGVAEAFERLVWDGSFGEFDDPRTAALGSVACLRTAVTVHRPKLRLFSWFFAEGPP